MSIAISGYEKEYEIHKNGSVFSKKLGRSLKQSSTKQGYKKVSLCKNGNQKTFKVHRLVAQAFIENPEKKITVNHKDGNKINNNLNNLEWATYSENAIHAYANGLRKPRSGNQYTKNNAVFKLDKSDKEYILKNISNFTQTELAKKFNVSQSAISKLILTNKKHKL